MNPIAPRFRPPFAQQETMDPAFVPWIMLAFGVVCLFGGASIVRSRRAYFARYDYTVVGVVAVLAGLTLMLLGVLGCVAGVFILFADKK